ncbi:MAG: phospholipase D-like domain-containing protein [Sphaerochaeta sp.]|jgi:polyphosphate kinase|nr:phospholipase D-like domain-containing protein [Sphaerochaeta sp.]
MTAKKKATPSRFINGPYINREHSWLLFNRRVLEQASDPANPLLERCKFLSIFSSNLDEFFMIRVGSLVTQMHHAPKLKENKTGLTAEQQLAGILCEVQNLYAQGKRTFASLRTQLYAHGVAITKGSELTAHQKNLCRSAFLLRFLPLLSPMVLDAKHPMIRFENLETYLVVHLHKVNRSMIGILGISPKLDRLFEIPGGKKAHVITSEELVATFADLAFPGYALKDKALVRVTRNADFDTRLQDGDLETDFDFTKYIQDKVEERSIMNVVRLEMDGDNETIRSFLLKNLNLSDKFCYRIKHAFDYSFMTKLDPFFPIEQLPALHYPPFKGAVPADLKEVPGMIERVRQGDVFLSYPFESMDPLVQLLNECADDPRTVSIKMTIYRIDSHSRIVEALKRASENKKEVTVLIELFARFDEENNLYYANMLREAGCTIFYGTANYKVHAKIISIIRTDGEEISYITHLGTGNYNEDTSRQYTDLNLITSDRRIGEDAVAFFRNLGHHELPLPLPGHVDRPVHAETGNHRRNRWGDIQSEGRDPCPDHRQDEQPDGQGDHRQTDPGKLRRRSHLPDRPGHLLPAARTERSDGPYQRDQHRRALFGTLPNLLFRGWGRAEDFHLQRRPDDPQHGQTHRDRHSDLRSPDRQTDQRHAGGTPVRHHQGEEAHLQRNLQTDSGQRETDGLPGLFPPSSRRDGLLIVSSPVWGYHRNVHQISGKIPEEGESNESTLWWSAGKAERNAIERRRQSAALHRGGERSRHL